METYIMLTKLAKTVLREPKTFVELSERIEAKVKAECPEVEWIGNYAVLGPYDYVDIFHAPDNETAMKVSAIIRSFGHATTETWPATEWNRFKSMVASGHTSVGLTPPHAGDAENNVTEAGEESFPASDPPAWTGSSAS